MSRSCESKLSAAIIAGLLVGFGPTTAAALRPEQFVSGWPLEITGDARIVDVPLTLDVYRRAASDDDIAVLDADGRPMPFYRVVQSSTAIEQGVMLEASPVYAAQDSSAVAQLSLEAADRRTNVTLTQPPAGAAQTEIVAFIVDARAFGDAPVALDLDWRAIWQPFLADVQIEQSTTLTDWQTVGRASIAALSIGGAEVRHGRVPVSAGPGGYYRITWGRAVEDWYLDAVTLVFTDHAQPAVETLTLAPLERSPAKAVPEQPKHALYFDAGGPVPVRSLTLDFTSDTGWTRADVASAASPDGPWSVVTGWTLFYELDYEGERLANEPVVIGRQAARYWRVVGAEPIARERVALRLEYPAEVLRVSTEGAAPFLLAAGTLAPEAGPDPTFAAVWRELPEGRAPLRATLGPLRELGGPAALEAPFELPWRVAALWAVLGVGVLAVAWMAVRLAREFRESPS